MKFIHMADMHFDAPFVTLAGKGNLATERRLEQRNVMKQIVEYIKQNNIPYLFIAGDLYEQEYIKKATIEYINNLFKEIPNTKIFITPGNHDPNIKNSFYQQFKWNENVHIFTNKIERIECDGVDIYGYGFNDFQMERPKQDIEIKDKNKINIFITHSSLDGEKEYIKYNPFATSELKKLDFDYVALGHIHKKSYNDYKNQNIVYPGSTVSLGFDELGERGIIEGEISEQKELKLKFIPVKEKTFEEKEIDISLLNAEEDLIEKIREENLEENKFYKIILTGKRNFDFDESKILDILNIQNIIKIRNQTQIKYDIEETAKQISLKGLFAKQILDQTNQANDEEKQKLLEAFETGMDILNKR